MDILNSINGSRKCADYSKKLPFILNITTDVPDILVGPVLSSEDKMSCSRTQHSASDKPQTRNP